MVARLAGFAAALAVAASGVGTATAAEAPEIAAAAGILIDASDGKILWEKDARVQRAPASTTKILTALVVLEHAAPSEIVTVSARAEAIGERTFVGASDLDLLRGEQRSVIELLYGLLLPSANDAAVALAEHVAGSEQAFVELMNRKAAALGAADSRFANSHGLDADGHHSTARDLALLGREAMSDEQFRDVAAARSFLLPGHRSRPARRIENRNLLLESYEGADGVKTGTTRRAGNSVVASATRQGERRLAVVLGGSSDALGEAATLLDYGFENFHRTVLVPNGVWGYATFGNGSTAEIRSASAVTVLAADTAPTAEVSFDAENSVLEIRTSSSVRRVSASVRCLAPPCGFDKRAAESPFLWMVELIAPLARFLEQLGSF
ncbi:MAG: D-alanyl-D-alanine carboxypeptidase family protein [Actinomycetota bacterium]